MKAYLKRYPTLIFGLGVPALIILIVLVGARLPAFLVAPPTYDVLYTTGNNSTGAVEIAVVNEQIEVLFNPSQRNQVRPKLWRYNANTGSVKPIPIPYHTISQDAEGFQAIPVFELATVTIDSSSIAPDGYELDTGSNTQRSLLGGLFNQRRYDRSLVLTKNGRRVHIPNTENSYQVSFIGWVIRK